MALIVLEVGRAGIAEEARAQFGGERTVEVLSHTGDLKVGEAAREIVTEFHARLLALKQTGEPIKVVLSGPVSLAFLLGMTVGINHFDLQVYHYDARRSGEKYVALETPTHDWVK